MDKSFSTFACVNFHDMVSHFVNVVVYKTYIQTKIKLNFRILYGSDMCCSLKNYMLADVVVLVLLVIELFIGLKIGYRNLNLPTAKVISGRYFWLYGNYNQII